jgi:cobalt-zinc-cadmium efflux system outer membrane protein
MWTIRATWRLLSLVLPSLLAAGCRAPSATLPPYHALAGKSAQMSLLPPEMHPVVEVPPPENLSDVIKVAVQHHPDLRVARARVDAAYGRMIQAGLCPNPAFGPHFTEIGDSAGRLGEAGAQLTQVIVTAHKLGIAKAAAAFGLEAADWQAITRWFDVVTRVRAAYYELLAALREQDTIQDIGRVSEEALKTAKTLEKAGVGSLADVLRAQVELEQNRLKKDVSLRRVEAARQNLLTAMGRPAVALDRLERNRKDLETAPPTFDWDKMLECVRYASSELQEARALIAQQEKLLARAKVEVVPNVTLTGIPFWVDSAREMRGEVIALVPIPVFDRNQGNIHAARADLTRAHADERALELRLTERLTLAYRNYQSARQQARSYETTIVPKARESLKLVQEGYRGGDRKFDYTALLQAQQVLFQAQLAHTQALGELWRSVVEIAGIVQQEDLMIGCAVKD